MALLRHSPLDPSLVLAEVCRPDVGGTALFIGTVRDNHRGRAVSGLEYSAYEEMAEAEARLILVEGMQRWDVRIAAQHRLGVLTISEVAFVVAAGAAHREAAFEACRWVVDAVKSRVPIWKLERYQDGTELWVDPTKQSEQPE